MPGRAAGYTQEPWFMQSTAQVFLHNPLKRKARAGSSWVTGSKAVIMLLPQVFITDQGQRRNERRGLRFGGRGTQVDVDVLAIHGSDVDSGFKARKYQLLEHAAPTAVMSTEQSAATAEQKKKPRCGEEGGSFGAVAVPDSTLRHFNTGTKTGAHNIQYITHAEANTMQSIRAVLSQFDDRKKIELLRKAQHDLLAELGNASVAAPW